MSDRPDESSERADGSEAVVPLAGSEHELRALSGELDELHHDVGMHACVDAAADMSGTSRRTFLLGAGADLVGGAALAAGSLPRRPSPAGRHPGANTVADRPAQLPRPASRAT